MSKIKEVKLEEEVDKITFECSNPKCGCTNFKLNTAHINGYGELGCPMCFTSDIKIIFLNYRKIKREK